jgi:hopanoid biosynthesis associated protein HpnK
MKSMTKKVIINADDMGASKGTNAAIARAFREGILTSTSIIVTMPAYEDAIENVVLPNPSLGIGIHLSLTEGKSILNKSAIPLLVDENGYFNKKFVDIYIGTKKQRDVLQQIYKELDAQFNRVCSDGIQIDHIDGHHHIHMIPPIFDIVIKLAEKYACPMVRLAHERFPFSTKGLYPSYYLSPLLNGNILKKILLSNFAKYNRKKFRNVWTSDHFFGVLHSGKMDMKNLLYIFRCIKPGITEIITHPSMYSILEADTYHYRKMEAWLRSRSRQVELEALLSEILRQEAERNGISLIRFSDVIPSI